MKVISVWQPYASLLVHGFKVTETRGFPIPQKLIGERLGIASTKIVKPEQRAAFADVPFARHYFETNLPRALDELPMGCLLGTVEITSCDLITEADLEDVTEEEKLYGWWEIGRYAWRTRDPQPFPKPIPVRGSQGIWTWDPDGAEVIPFEQGRRRAG